MDIKKVTITNGNITSVYSYEVTECLYKGVKAYGITVSRRDVQDEIVIKEVSDSVHLITPNKEKIMVILEKLYKSVVSPVHLIDIIGEYVDVWVNEFDLIDNFQKV
ncbi:MAG: DUF6514 family protein [Clostridium sp.]